MEKRKLTLLGFITVLAVGLSVALYQGVSLAQETTVSTPVTQGAAKDAKKSTHKSGKRKMKDMKNKKGEPKEVKTDTTGSQVVK